MLDFDKNKLLINSKVCEVLLSDVLKVIVLPKSFILAMLQTFIHKKSSLFLSRDFAAAIKNIYYVLFMIAHLVLYKVT